MKHWERGYRCHGYWDGAIRLGVVSLPPHGFGRKYRIYIDGTGNTVYDEEYDDLKKAKKRVEELVEGISEK